jgi:hypothetical protein
MTTRTQRLGVACIVGGAMLIAGICGVPASAKTITSGCAPWEHTCVVVGPDISDLLPGNSIVIPIQVSLPECGDASGISNSGATASDTCVFVGVDPIP